MILQLTYLVHLVQIRIRHLSRAASETDQRAKDIRGY